jgi:hypothetical protein
MMQDRYYYERASKHPDPLSGRDMHDVLSNDSGQVYAIYDRRRGCYDPLGYVLSASDAETFVTALNGLVNSPTCCSTS